MHSSLKIREALLEDAKSILEIYEPYIINTTVTYEYEPVPLQQFQERMLSTMARYPWLVAEEDGQICGYAYASAHWERAAFDWDCETSVYIALEHQGKGIAVALYDKLLSVLEVLNYVTVYSLIDLPNDKSVALHEKFGFQKMAVYKKTAYKHGRWLNLLVMEKRFHEKKPRPIKKQWLPYL